jgi:hypothetical protein
MAASRRISRMSSGAYDRAKDPPTVIVRSRRPERLRLGVRRPATAGMRFKCPSPAFRKSRPPAGSLAAYVLGGIVAECPFWSLCRQATAVTSDRLLEQPLSLGPCRPDAGALLRSRRVCSRSLATALRICEALGVKAVHIVDEEWVGFQEGHRGAAAHRRAPSRHAFIGAPLS